MAMCRGAMSFTSLEQPIDLQMIRGFREIHAMTSCSYEACAFDDPAREWKKMCGETELELFEYLYLHDE
jgi:hypothetical protein